MKKMLAILLMMIIVITMASVAISAEEVKYIPISTAEGLKNIGDDLKANYILTANIDLNGFEWDSIGTDPFTGILEGNGYIIFNLTCESYMAKVGGLFMENKGTIRNLCLANVKISEKATTKYDNIGAIAGTNYGTIENCHVEGLMEMAEASYVGFIAGYNDGLIKNCSVAGAINAAYHMGGFVGQNRNLGSVQNCVNYAAVTGTHNRVGGIIGTVQTNTGAEYVVLNALNYGEVKSIPCTDSATHGSTGGIIGHYQKTGCPVENCANLGLVTGAGCKSVITGSASNKDAVKNVYYLEGTVADPSLISESVEAGVAKSAVDFATGAVTTLLGNAFKNNDGADGSTYPILIAGNWATGFSSINYYDARELVGINDLTKPAAVGTGVFNLVEPVETTAISATTTVPEITTAKPADTTKPVEADTTVVTADTTSETSATTTEGTKEKDGCGKSSMIFIQLVVILSSALVFIIKKK